MELRELEDTQLKAKIAESKTKLDDMKFDIKTGVLTDLSGYRKEKKELAKMMTIKRERELGIKVVIKKKAPKKEVKTVETSKEEKKETKKVVKKTKKVTAKKS